MCYITEFQLKLFPHKSKRPIEVPVRKVSQMKGIPTDMGRGRPRNRPYH